MKDNMTTTKTGPMSTRTTAEIIGQLSEHRKQLEGWKLVVGLYSERRSTEEDLIHAYAVEACELMQRAMRMLFELGAASIMQQRSSCEHLRRCIAEHDERAVVLAKLCRQVLGNDGKFREMAGL